MPACEACHRAKVRCDQHDPCGRCCRLNIECVQRISKQGQGPKPRKHQNASTKTTITNTNKRAKSEDETLCQHFETTLGKHHFGVLYLIHSWISFAFSRRSFALLARASRLAATCEIPMDEIFSQQRRQIMDPILWDSTRQHYQKNSAVTPVLQWSDLPADLCQTCLVADESSFRSKRYIFIREAKNGHSRFLLSEAFQRDISSQWLIEQTWRANEIPVVQVFLEGPDDFDKFTNAVQYQMSRYTHPGRPVECVRVNGLRVKMAGTRGSSYHVQQMDLVYAFEIVTLEHSYYLGELVLPKRQSITTTASQSTQQDDLDNTSFDSEDFMDVFDNLDDLVVDEDFEAFVSFISGTD